LISIISAAAFIVGSGVIMLGGGSVFVYIITGQVMYATGALMVLVVANVADYLRQADDHGWTNPVWTNGRRAPKWGLFDFIPHDEYHVSQTIARWGMVIGSILAWHIIDGEWYVRLAIVIACNAIGRGIGFSIPYRILN